MFWRKIYISIMLCASQESTGDDRPTLKRKKFPWREKSTAYSKQIIMADQIYILVICALFIGLFDIQILQFLGEQKGKCKCSVGV